MTTAERYPARSRRGQDVRPSRGDERCARLLDALRELLATRPLADVGIVDITRAAGVTRSAFYFYFPTKAAAVAALLTDLRERIRQAGATWYESDDGSPHERVRSTVDASVTLWRGEAGLLVAMLDATAADPEVRALWRSWLDGFAEQVAARIDRDRAAGLVGAASGSGALARLLLGATADALERDVRAITAGDPPSPTLPAALSELWYRTLYA